ncbi:hypothetical protein M3J07_005634 [Ascochyta lentis]
MGWFLEGKWRGDYLTMLLVSRDMTSWA